ncbi:MAG: RDD family protein [Gammaproteobacteria bacterium]|nr:RDD family protein [Gammaproteobacteria bacterium]MDH5618690.1 RDD family protein [Gammaproteobacteria bacterium]
MQNTGLLRRFGAIIYDALLVGALLFLATIPFIAVRGGEPVETGDNTLYRLVLAGVVYLFFVGFWTRAGRTLGMQSWGLQLQTADNAKPGVAAASIRFFAALLSWAPAGLGFLWQLWDRDKLTWHDRLSGTRLVYYPKPGKAKKQAG